MYVGGGRRGYPGEVRLVRVRPCDSRAGRHMKRRRTRRGFKAAALGLAAASLLGACLCGIYLLVDSRPQGEVVELMAEKLPEEVPGSPLDVGSVNIVQALEKPEPEPQPEPEPAPVQAAPVQEPPAPEPAEEPTHQFLEPENPGYINVMQVLVEEKAPKYVEMFGLCSCKRCMEDVKAFTLNHLPPKYVVLEPNDRVPRLTVYEGKFSSDITAQLLQACKAVHETPHHSRG